MINCNQCMLTWLSPGVEMIRFGHDMIRFMIHNSRYHTFHDTFVVLGWKAETYNPGLWSKAPHSTCYCCLCSDHAQWVQQWQPHQSFQVQRFCVEFPRYIGIYWLLSVSISCSFLTIAWDRTVSYRIVISLSISRYVLSAQIYCCTGTMMNRFTPTLYHHPCIHRTGHGTLLAHLPLDKKATINEKYLSFGIWCILY